MTILALLILAGIAVFYYMRRQSSSSIAGRLPGPGTYEFDIVGESKYQDVLESICGGRTEEGAEHLTHAVLTLEDQNPYDNKAVRVDIEGHTVGYLSRQNARSYRKQLQRLGHPRIACVCNAMVVGGWERTPSDRGHFGVKLDLPVGE